jgi:hypothetical protein
MIAIDSSNIICISFSLAILTVYHIILAIAVKQHPEWTVHGLSHISRHLWVCSILKNEQHDILAIQTMRNFIMASSFMATTSVAIAFGFIAFLSSPKVFLGDANTTDTTANATNVDQLVASIKLASDGLISVKVRYP